MRARQIAVSMLNETSAELTFRLICFDLFGRGTGAAGGDCSEGHAATEAF